MCTGRVSRSTQSQHDLVLRHVGVLVLVDEKVAEPSPIFVENIRALVQQSHCQGEQIIKVGRSSTFEASLILGIDLGMTASENVISGRNRSCGVDKFVLEQRNVAVNRPRVEPLRVEPHIAHHVPREANCVTLVVNRERSRQPNAFGMHTKNSHTGRVKCAHPHALHHRAHKISDPVAHFTCCLIGERDRKNL